MPVYLIRLAQVHESFRKVELQALADILGVNVEFVSYEEDVSQYSQHLLNSFSSTRFPIVQLTLTV